MSRENAPGDGRAATMKDVAARAGVGLATVSRVINGVPVDPVLTARVLEAARELGYRKDIAATTLRRADRRTNTIGLVLEDLANPFSSTLHRAVEDACARRGVLVLAGSSDQEPDRERELLGALLRTRRVDGLIVVPTGSADEELSFAHGAGIPIVCVDRASPVDGVDTVTVDNRGGVGTAVRTLHALGHRRIAFIGDRTSLWTARERFAGFTEAMTALHCEASPRWTRRDVDSAEASHEAVSRILRADPAPTAIITAQNVLTIGARRALVDLGAQHLVAHIGFDDFPMADMLNPPMSVIAQDPVEMGKRAAEILFSRMDGARPDGERVTLTLPTRYIARGSGEIKPSGH